MGATLHRQETLHVFQDEKCRLMLPQDIDDDTKESSTRVFDALLLSCTAKRLAWKASGQ